MVACVAICKTFCRCIALEHRLVTCIVYVQFTVEYTLHAAGKDNLYGVKFAYDRLNAGELEFIRVCRFIYTKA